MSAQPPYRVGLGYDIHPLVSGRPCILGGITLPVPVGPEGHSDADVLLHAVADALLGAAGLRDIGYYFPNTDPNIKNIKSTLIVQKALEEIKKLGWKVGNVDVVVIAERPKISGFIDQIKKSIAGILEISESQVGVKATTHEGMDSIGEGKAIAVQAICMIFKA
jgi:2-C-methyl-D-erythritol 2,4-cyclodiphosphate synthase